MSEEEKKLRLEQLTITNYSFQNGPEIKAKFSGQYANGIELKLSPEVAEQVLNLCAKELTAAINNSFRQFSQEVLKVGNLIEHQKEEEEIVEKLEEGGFDEEVQF